MKNLLRAIALFMALMIAALALACGGTDSGKNTGDNDSKTTGGPEMQAMMPPISWNELEDAEMLKLTVNGKEKTYTASELFKLDRGALVGWYEGDGDVRGGRPMYFCGVFIKGLVYDTDNAVDFENIKSLKLIGVDGKETVLDGELASSIILESVLALQRGGIVTDAESGCMLVLKSDSGKDQLNKIYMGIAEMVVG